MMTDESDNERAIKTEAEMLRRIAAGESVYTFQMIQVVQVETTPEGEAAVDFVFAGTPDSQALVARLIIGPESARALKAALVANQNIPDTPPPERDRRSTQ